VNLWKKCSILAAVVLLMFVWRPALATVVNALYDFVQISAPSNPASGNSRVYVDSGTHKLSCLNSDGSSCAPTGGGGGAFTQIARTVLGSPSATVTFSSLGSFNHLQLVINAACSGAVTGDFVDLQANGDAGSNYQWQYAGAIGGSTNTFHGSGTATGHIGNVSCASAPANAQGIVNFTLEDYATTTFSKQGTGTTGYVADTVYTGNLFNATFYWIWTSTSAITSIVLSLTGGSNFITGSTFTLYGLN
jgi:hypothetical protein